MSGSPNSAGEKKGRGNAEGSKATQFVPGQTGNPKGRPKGSRNKLGEDFVQALQSDFAEHGAEAIVEVRENRPQDYLKVIAGILPKDVNIKVNPLEEMTDEQLLARLRNLDAYIRPFLVAEGTSGVDSGASEATAH